MNRLNRSGTVTIRNFLRAGIPQLAMQYRAGRAIVNVILDRLGPRRGPAFTLVRFVVGNKPIYRQRFPPSPTGGAEIQQFIVRFISKMTRQPLQTVTRIPPRPMTMRDGLMRGGMRGGMMMRGGGMMGPQRGMGGGFGRGIRR